MASDNHASYARIGLAAVLGVAAAVATLVYIGGVGGRSDEMLAETYYDNPVTGLSVGSEVNFRGVKVGEVRDISFIGSRYDDVAEKDMQKIYILIAFKTRLFRLEDWESPEETVRYLVRKGVRATVSSSGVTGLSKIELNFPKTPTEPEPISWTPEHVCIPPTPSMLESFSDSATKVMNQINQMDFTALWSNITVIADSVARLTRGAGEVVESQKATVSDILLNLEDASRSLRELSAALRENPSLLLRENDPAPLPETAR